MAEESTIKTETAKFVRKRKNIRNPISQMEAWTIAQKKKILSLLTEYPIDAYSIIASRIPGKDEEQVKNYIERIKKQIKNSNQPKGTSREFVKRAPLEDWIETVSDMIEFENVDSSTNLTKVLSVISNFEDFETVKLEGHSGPNYESIYKYLSQALQAERHEDMIHLPPLECAIMLDMLHGLMEVLSCRDTMVQRNVMKWKYQLMNARNCMGHSIPECLKKASENDFSDFINEARMLRKQNLEHEKRYTARKKPQAKDGNSDKKQEMIKTAYRKATKPTSSAELGDKKKTLFETAYGKSTASTSAVEPSTTCKKNASTSSESLSKHSQSDTADEEGIKTEDTDKDKPPIKRHKPGRKGALDPPEVPYTEIVLVMPPKGVEIVNYIPRNKKTAKERLDGKYQSLNPEEELINNDLSREITYDVHRSELDQFHVRSKSVNKGKRRVGMDTDIDARYNHIMKSQDEHLRNAPAKKPKLYSLNPFCLPVKLIDLDAGMKKTSQKH